MSEEQDPVRSALADIDGLADRLVMTRLKDKVATIVVGGIRFSHERSLAKDG